MQTRRHLIAVLGFAAALIAACNGGAPSDPVTGDDVSLGNPNAPIKVVEYASITCPHCARWGLEVFPEFKTKYIDSGEVYFTSREILGHNPAFAAAGYLTARCAGEDRYFDVIHDLYAQQTDIIASGQYAQKLEAIARSHGLSKAAFDACIQDTAAIEAIRDRNNRYLEEGFNSTPTFVVNGQIYEGVQDMAAFETIFANAKAAPAAPSAPEAK